MIIFPSDAKSADNNILESNSLSHMCNGSTTKPIDKTFLILYTFM